MTCGEALNRMLEAEPAALRADAGADPVLAEHLRGCGRCRRVAATLVTELEALDAGLEELATAPGPSRSGSDSPGGSRPRRAAGSGRGVVRRLGTWVPLAAAAVLAAVLLLRPGGDPDPPPDGPAGAGAAASVARPGRVAVTLPADRGGAVMSTRNPNITVVWLYERSER